MENTGYTPRERSLILENEQLRKALAISLNKSLLKKLVEALHRMQEGDYLTEEEFFKD